MFKITYPKVFAVIGIIFSIFLFFNTSYTHCYGGFEGPTRCDATILGAMKWFSWALAFELIFFLESFDFITPYLGDWNLYAIYAIAFPVLYGVVGLILGYIIVWLKNKFLNPK